MLSGSFNGIALLPTNRTTGVVHTCNAGSIVWAGKGMENLVP